MLYRPSPSVTTLRTFSMRAGLAASTETPGMANPALSLTTPPIPEACCAHAAEANRVMTTRRKKALAQRGDRPRFVRATYPSQHLQQRAKSNGGEITSARLDLQAK